MKDMLATGKTGSPHGLRGFLKVFPYSGDISHLYSLKTVVLEKNGRRRTETVEEVRENGSYALVKFRGFDTPEVASSLSGWDILVPREQAAELKNGEVYASDLIGLDVVFNNEVVAEVVSFAEGAQSLLLEVRCPDGKTRFVPYMKGVFVNAPDFSDNTIELLRTDLLE